MEIIGDISHDQYWKMDIFIYLFFQVVCYIYFFKSLLFADQMTQKLFKVARKNQQGAELK